MTRLKQTKEEGKTSVSFPIRPSPFLLTRSRSRRLQRPPPPPPRPPPPPVPLRVAHLHHRGPHEPVAHRVPPAELLQDGAVGHRVVELAHHRLVHVGVERRPRAGDRGHADAAERVEELLLEAAVGGGDLGGRGVLVEGRGAGLRGGGGGRGEERGGGVERVGERHQRLDGLRLGPGRQRGLLALGAPPEVFEFGAEPQEGVFRGLQLGLRGLGAGLGRGREARGVGGCAAERVDGFRERRQGLVVAGLLEGREGVARVLVEDLVRGPSVDDAAAVVVAGGRGAEGRRDEVEEGVVVFREVLFVFVFRSRDRLCTFSLSLLFLSLLL